MRRQYFSRRYRPELVSEGQLNAHPRQPTEQDHPVLLQRVTQKPDSVFHRQHKENVTASMKVYANLRAPYKERE